MPVADRTQPERRWLTIRLVVAGAVIGRTAWSGGCVTDALLMRYEACLDLGKNEEDRPANHRDLFRPELDVAAIGDIRMALSQGQRMGIPACSKA